MSTVNAATSNSTTTGSSASATSTSSALADAQKQKDQFLKILLTQLQNQNPMDPQKPEQFASQLAQFSALEQQINTNTKLDSLVSAMGDNSVPAVSYLGNTVDYDSATAPVQSDYANWTYRVAGASSVTLTVKDADGKVIYTGNGDTSSSAHQLQLEAKGAAAGTPLTLSVVAKDANGDVIASTITARAKITAVSTANGATSLEADGYAIQTASVKRIATTQSAANGTNSTTTPNS